MGAHTQEHKYLPMAKLGWLSDAYCATYDCESKLLGYAYAYAQATDRTWNVPASLALYFYCCVPVDALINFLLRKVSN